MSSALAFYAVFGDDTQQHRALRMLEERAKRADARKEKARLRAKARRVRLKKENKR